MQSLQLYNRETEHTSNWSEVRFETNKVYQITNKYRDIHTQEQLAKIIDNLVIDKGFIMNKHVNNVLTLENPTDTENIYWVWAETQCCGKTQCCGITKRTKRLVGKLDV